MDPKKDYYKILGINESTSPDDIKKAYRKLAKEYHPDTKGGDRSAEERFKDISEAYAILKDPKKRREYDLMRKNPFASGAGGFNYDSGGDFSEFRMNFGNSGGNFSGIDDLLGSFFGFGGRRSRSDYNHQDSFFNQYRTRQPRKGEDFQANISIPFELAARGGETYVRTPTNKRIKLKIAPGTENGKKVKMTGYGATPPGGGTPGDLYITLQVEKHPKFERKGNDIYSTEQINVAQALLGTEIEVSTIRNQKIKLKIPPGTDSGKLFRLKKLGIESSNGVGDHYVRIMISTPKKMNNKSRKLFEEWARVEGLVL